jgi:hypothetical protein
MAKWYCIYILLLPLPSLAQDDSIRLVNYFSDGKISTIQVWKDLGGGYARAFNRAGEVIYERDIRRFAGSAGVSFRYYPSGAVQRADYSSHPDGGIQWWRSTTVFDENGQIISETEDNFDGFPRNPRVYIIERKDSLQHLTPVVTPESPPAPQKEYMRCANIHRHKTHFTNQSNKALLLSITFARQDTVLILGGGRSFEGPSFISAELRNPWEHYVKVAYNGKRPRHAFVMQVETMEINSLETHYHFHFYKKRRP